MFRIIKGTFHVAGFQPDGDSIRFRAEKSSQWAHFKWKKLPKRKNPMVQIRLEGIDAVETHYNGYSQPRSFGQKLGTVSVGSDQSNPSTMLDSSLSSITW